MKITKYQKDHLRLYIAHDEDGRVIKSEMIGRKFKDLYLSLFGPKPWLEYADIAEFEKLTGQKILKIEKDE